MNAKDKTAELAREIAGYLDGWQAKTDEDSYGASLVHEGGARVFVHASGYSSSPKGGRLSASIVVPWDQLSPFDLTDHGTKHYGERDAYVNADRHYNGSESVDRFRKHVTFAHDRGADAIAKDLARRLLGDAIDYHAKAMEKVREHRAAIDKQAATIADICARAKGARPYGKDAIRFGDYDRANVGTDGMVQIERLNMTAQQFIDVTRLLSGETIGIF